MKYNMLYNEFLKLFPEDTDMLNKMSNELSVDPSDGMHVIFGMVVVPFVLKLIAKKDEKKLKTAFHFFEKMAISTDPLVCEVLEFTVLEALISQDKRLLNDCKSYMERETLKSCQAVERYMI